MHDRETLRSAAHVKGGAYSRVGTVRCVGGNAKCTEHYCVQKCKAWKALQHHERAIVQGG